LKPRCAGQILSVLQQSKRALGLAHSSEQNRALQVDVGALTAGDRLCAIEELHRFVKPAKSLMKLGQIDNWLQRPRISFGSALERRPSLLQFPKP